ncbi:type II secretion system F family protein [Halobacillus salinus]|uniref:type II secretion system F family protein n=1 Tax=Halobacillus salinus TaxID=192814 RepID=UPI0009A786F5|nr:type II secretion system F family protein [Halobacillus salinus]
MRSAISRRADWIIRRRERLSVKTQILFFHRISHILSKGYPLLEAMKIAAWDPKLIPITSELSIQLQRGATLDEAFEKVNFSPFVVTFLYFGKHHLDLSGTFRQCEKMLTLQSTYKQKVIQALRYPLFLLLFIIIAFGVIQRNILPNFLLLFENERTLWLMKLISLSLNLFGIVAILLTLLSLLWYLFSPKVELPTYLKMIDRIKLIREAYSLVLSYLFTSHMQTLLSTGLSLKQSLDLITHQTRHRVLAHYGERILQDLQDGKTIGQAIHPCSLLREELTNLFHQTNDVQALTSELELLEHFYLNYMETTLSKWVQRIQPTFFILIAILVVTIYASIMLPLYQWMDQM